MFYCGGLIFPRPGLNLSRVPTHVWFSTVDADGDGSVSPGEFDPMLDEEVLRQFKRR